MHKLSCLLFCCLLFCCVLLLSACATIPEGYKLHQGQIYKNHDAFEDVTLYEHEDFLLRRGASTYFKGIRMNATVLVDLYVAQSSKNKTLRIQFSYEDFNWIHFKKVILLNEDNARMVFRWSPVNKKKNIYSDSNIVSEKVDFALSQKQIKELNKMLISNRLKLRLAGKYDDDFDISTEQIKLLRKMIVFFESL